MDKKIAALIHARKRFSVTNYHCNSQETECLGGTLTIGFEYFLLYLVKLVNTTVKLLTSEVCKMLSKFLQNLTARFS